MKKTVRTATLLLTAVLVISLFAGCGGGTPANNSGNTVPGNNSSNVVPGNNANSVTPGNNSNNTEPPKKEPLKVGSVEELLAAIAPGAEIVIKQGRYELSSALKSLAAQDLNKWNASHKYVRIAECNDGLELVICGVDGLKISGETNSYTDTQLLTDPRYANVLNFENCKNIELKRFTLGHTISVECGADVLCLKDTTGVVLQSMDLFGCGVYGLRMEGLSGDVSVKDSVIRDCSSGTFQIEGCIGPVVFDNCVLTGSGHASYFVLNADSTMVLRNCTLGKAESESIYFMEHILCDNCRITEPEFYPDYGGTGMFIPEEMSEAPADKEVLIAGSWLAYILVDKSADLETDEYVPYVDPRDGSPMRLSMHFSLEGNGIIKGYAKDSIDFTWTAKDGIVSYKAPSAGLEGNIKFYTITEYDNSVTTWLRIEFGDWKAWLSLLKAY